MKDKKRLFTKLTALVCAILCIAFFTVSVMGLGGIEPKNPIGQHNAKIIEDKQVTGKDKKEDQDRDGIKAITDSNKQDKKGEALKGKDKEKEGETVESEVKEDSDDNRGNIDGLKENNQASDENGDGQTGEESPLPTENQKASIATDLKNQIITEKQLRNSEFSFYAYIVHKEKDQSLKVKIRNENTSINGKILNSGSKDYRTVLTKGYNYITLYLKEKGETVYQITYAINYVSDKADIDNPEVGEHPPVIKTNLDNRSKTIKNRNFILTVTAKTYRDKYLGKDNMRVTMDGKVIKTTPTGNGTMEYDLYFSNPKIGDSEAHTVTVLAWDNEGNSKFRVYTVVYEFVEEGDVIGHATVNVDATSIGLGVIASGVKCEIKQDEPASEVVLEALGEYGFSAGYSGTAKAGFYLKSLSAGYIANGASIPSNLLEKIKDDGLNMTGQKNKNKISEFDYTEGSGWMYTIDGSLYPGRGLSGYYLEDGDIVTLRFTLAYGKDLGAASSKGLLSSYCGIWSNGSYKANHKMGKPKVVTEAGCEKTGLIETACTVKGCREKKQETVKALGHDFRETGRTEPAGDSDGQITYKCSRCGAEKTSRIPATGGEDSSNQGEE